MSGNVSYIYDELGQLISETNGNTTYEYAYDSKGNISSRKAYSGETLVDTDTFTYGADIWKDRLTGYNNGTITYDTIGNPTSYLGATLTWRGRELSSYSKDGKQISYSYDVDGMRYKKTVTEDDSVTAVYDYVYSDGKLILLTYTANGTANTARFIYDSFGEPRGFILNNSSAYLYLKNGQGDITAIVDENGAVLLTYSYTAWGEITYSATSVQNMLLAAMLSNVNPFTYRGYCYDYDIGMYYLQSRYYDPEICRFISADSTDYLGATGTLLAYNLFAYCENDGVNTIDATGTCGEDVHRGYYEKDPENSNFSTSRITKIGYSNYIYKGWSLYIPCIRENKTIYSYYGTYYWAIQCGISASNAKIIADACKEVDDLDKGISWAPYIGDQSWHFNTNWGTSKKDSRILNSNTALKKAKSYLSMGDKNNGLRYIGRALHPIQDIYAHTRNVCFYYNLPLTIQKYPGVSYGPTMTVNVKFWKHPSKAYDSSGKKVSVDSAEQRKTQLRECEKKTKRILKDMVALYPILK